MKKLLLLTLVFSSLAQAGDVYRCQKEYLMKPNALNKPHFEDDFQFSEGETSNNELIGLSFSSVFKKAELTFFGGTYICQESADSKLSNCFDKSKIPLLGSDTSQIQQSKIRSYLSSQTSLDLSSFESLIQSTHLTRQYLFPPNVFKEYKLRKDKQKYDCQLNLAVDHSEGTPDKPNNAIGVPRDNSVLEHGAIQLD